MKILIVRYGSLGDVVLITPVLRVLKLQLNATIHVLTKAVNGPLLKGHRRVDKLLFHEDQSISTLKSEAYDYVVDLHNNLRSFILKRRLGVRSVSYDKMVVGKWLYLLFKINILNKSHVVDRYLATLAPLGVKDDGQGLELGIGNVNKSFGFTTDKKIVVVVLGGTYQTKRIPIHLLSKVIVRRDLQYVLIGGDDVNIRHEAFSSNVYNLVGQTSLEESVDIVAQAAIVVTGDTGMMHVAAAFQKPVITIWGSTSDNFGFYPYYGSQSEMDYVSIRNENLSCSPCSKYGKKQCPKGHMKCLMDIDPLVINQEIDKLSR